MGVGLWKNSFDIKTNTALEAVSFGRRVLGMPGPVGTFGRGTTRKRYRERSRQAGCAGGLPNAWESLSASPVSG